MTNRYSKRLRHEPPEYGIFSKQCLICLDTKHSDFYKNNPNCEHNICIICFDKWIEINYKCPLCKKDLIYSIDNDYRIHAPNVLIKAANFIGHFFKFIHQYMWSYEHNAHIIYDDDIDDITNAILQDIYSNDDY